MLILGIIPARYASTRFPGKPLVDIGGKTMIQRVYEQASLILPLIYVATDDERIAEAVTAFGGNVIMTAKSHRSGTERCAEAVVKIQSSRNIRFEVVINIQGDEPFIAPEQLHQLASCFHTPETQIATLVKRFTPDEDLLSPNTPKVVLNKECEAIYFSRSVIPYVRDAQPNEWSRRTSFYKHIGLYAYRTDVLLSLSQLAPTPLEIAENLEQLRWIENGFHIKATVTDFPTHAIDTPEDLERLKSLGLY